MVMINLHFASKLKELLSHIPLLVLFPFNLSHHFYINIKPIKNKVKTLLKENALLNETDLYETYDPVLKRIPQNISKTFHELHTLISEMQYQNFNDIHLSQDILSNITNSSSNIIKLNITNAISQTPNKLTSTQSLPFFDPSFFA